MQALDHRIVKAAISYLIGAVCIYYFLDYPKTIQDLIEKSIVNTDNGLLILAAARHVFFGMLFTLPFLGGTYYLPNDAILPSLIIVVLVSVQVTPSTDPMLLLIIALVGYALLKPLHEQYFGMLAVFLVLLQLLLGFGWLNFLSWYQSIISLSDIPKDVKIAADYTRGISALNFVSLFLWVAFSLSAVFSSRLFVFYNKSLRESERRKKEEMALQEMKMRAEEARLLQEMHALVHDLKTPLMTVQGLNSLVEMAAGDQKIQKYCKKISTAVDNVNEMVSEILYDEVRKEISVGDFINYVRAHVLVKMQGQQIKFVIDPKLPLISVNHIRMARAFTNLIQNAFAATDKSDKGLIEVIAKPVGGDVVFSIRDNGIGIEQADLEEIWSLGFSTKNSSGLGLSFVKRVVENHGGEINIISEVGKGTTVEIKLPGVRMDDKDTDN